MVVAFGTDGFSPEWPAATLCLGTFDGVHKGHQALLSDAVRRATERRQPAVAVTFDRHPRAVLDPKGAPPALATLDQNLRWIAETGVAATVVLPFTRELASTPAQDFLKDVLVGALRGDSISVGEDFAFGKGREGTSAWLADRIATTVVPPVGFGGAKISSSRIRSLITEGKVEDAADLLGRPWSFNGPVVRGQQLGRTLDMPTVNIARSSGLILPRYGVYGGSCWAAGREWRAAINVGVRPAVGDGLSPTVEAHLIGYRGPELYGHPLELQFRSWLREERKFESMDELKAQMRADVRDIRDT